MRQDINQSMCSVTEKKEVQVSEKHRGQLCQELMKATA